MKKVKLLILGILSIIGLSSITFGYTSNGIIYQNGIYRNSLNGLLTYIYNDTAITVADKYIGQSVYQLSGQVPLGFASLFLQGNNFAFEYGETYPQGLSISDGSIYGPGNYLNTGILPNSSDWVSSNYSNMWGAVDGTFEAMRGPCPLGFHVMSSGEFIDFFNLVSSLGCFEQLSIYSRGVYPLNGSLIDNNSYGYSLSNLFGIGYIRGGFCQGGTISNYGKTNLYPVRCVPNSLKLPTSNNRTLEYQGSLEGLPEESEPEDSGDVEIYSVGTDYYNVNKSLIEAAVWCYITSGQYMDGSFIEGDTGCDALNYVDFIEGLDVDVSSRYFDNVSKYGNLKFNDSSKVLYYYCLSDSLSYPFCNDLDFYSSTYLIYSVVAQGSGPSRLMYNIYGSGVNVAIENNGTGYFGYTTCNGIWCSEVSTGSPTYVETSYNEYTGYDFQYLPSIDSFNVENTSSFFFNCPYPYTKVFISLDNKIVDYLAGTKLGRVINCPISAFRYGYRTLIFGDLNGTGYYRDGHLFNGNTPGHRALFMFFDIILSLIIIVILVKFYKLLSK